MRIAIITRSTLYAVPGGDTVQVVQTAKHLEKIGVKAEIRLTNDKIDYSRYQLLHFINIIRPSDILFHIARAKLPFVLSPILVDYREYDTKHRKGLSGFILRQVSSSGIEYTKSFARWLAGKDTLKSKDYLWKGQKRSIREIIRKAALLLPNSEAEAGKMEQEYGIKKDYIVVPNGVDDSFFTPDHKAKKDEKMVLCAARIEGIKNQLNLIKALNNSVYTLILVGAAAPNQKSYYRECRKIAAKNIVFHDYVPQEKLVNYYSQAKVHALPSWFEACGLSSLEAAAMGCNIAITDKGYTKEYFGNEAFYCDPADPESIFGEVEKASKSQCRTNLQQRVLQNYTWQKAASITSEAYKKVLLS